jgi:protein SCO1/2
MKTRDIISWLLALFIVGTIVGGALFVRDALYPQTAPPDFGATDVTGVEWGRDFNLTGDDGRVHELADFRGKVVALYFGYTRCPDVCPTTLATLAQAKRLLDRYGERVQVLFVTVDPRHDGPAVLGRYVRAFDPQFLGLYGERKAIARTAREFKVELGEHHSIPVFLLDTTGRLRLVVRPEASAESIAHDLRSLLGLPAV